MCCHRSADSRTHTPFLDLVAVGQGHPHLNNRIRTGELPFRDETGFCHAGDELSLHDTPFHKPLPRVVADQVLAFGHELADFIKELGHDLVPRANHGEPSRMSVQMYRLHQAFGPGFRYVAPPRTKVVPPVW